MPITAEELVAMNQPVNPDDYSDPGLKAQAVEMNRKFTQTQQALQEAIRGQKAWEAKLPDMELMHKEYTWMRNNQQIDNYLKGVQSGQIQPDDPNGIALANRGAQPNPNPQPPVNPNQSGFDWGNLPDPLTDAGQFGTQLQAGVQSMIGDQIAHAVNSAMDKKVTPLFTELANREIGRSTTEQNQRFSAMEQTYPDWAQVKDSVLADIKQYPGMDLGKAYRGNGGSGVTFSEAARANLTPASGVKRHADDGPKDPKDWNSTAEFVEQRMNELNAPMPAQPQMPGLPSIPGVAPQQAQVSPVAHY